MHINYTNFKLMHFIYTCSKEMHITYTYYTAKHIIYTCHKEMHIIHTCSKEMHIISQCSKQCLPMAVRKINIFYTGKHNDSFPSGLCLILVLLSLLLAKLLFL
jgi:hypothetical protein